MDGGVESIEFRAQMLARDPDNVIDGKPVPVITTLPHVYCNNDVHKFEKLCELIGIVQQKTIELTKQEM